MAEKVAAGDLSTRIDVDGSDETAQLLQSLQTMTHGLVSIVSQVRNSSDSIATGSSEIAMGNADLSQRTEEQASNLQQTAASMEEMNVTIKQNADTARTANQLSTSASQVAAKEIKSLISQSLDKVEAGSRYVGEAGLTMDDIVNQVRRVADLIGEIGAATSEQTQGIDQISNAVNQLDQVTQQNAALVEESAAAAESLKHQAASLAHVVSVFKLN